MEAKCDSADDVIESVASRLDLVGTMKSPGDKKQYRIIRLANGLRALLIEDTPAMEDTDSKDDGGSGAGAGADEEDGQGSQQAAVALAVSVGSLSDPEWMPGCAHACEHLLFMGSRRYPEENAYDSFLSEHGGSSNGATYANHTCYTFDVTPAHLEGALDRLSAIFEHPLWRADVTERELQAVDSEWSNASVSDYNRAGEISLRAGREGHPGSKFQWGNWRSLWTRPRQAGAQPRRAFLRFYAEHYRSSRMHLVVRAPLPLDRLQEIVAPRFARIPEVPDLRALMDAEEQNERALAPEEEQRAPSAASNGAAPSLPVAAHADPGVAKPELGNATAAAGSSATEGMPASGAGAEEKRSTASSAASSGPLAGAPALAPYTWSQEVMRAGPLWGLDSLPVMNVVRPVSDRHWLQLEFCMPTTLGCWRAFADQHLSHCLGHEGEGSVLRELQRRGWATSLSAGTGSEETAAYSVFEVSVGLSRAGAMAWPGVIECIFAYIQMMRTQEANRSCWEEQAALQKMHFLHPTESAPYEQTEDISSQLAELGCIARACASHDGKAADATKEEDVDPRLFGDEWLPLLESAAGDHVVALGSARKQGIGLCKSSEEQLALDTKEIARRWLMILQRTHSGPVGDDSILKYDVQGEWTDGVTGPACDATAALLAPSLCRATLVSSLFGRDAGAMQPQAATPTASSESPKASASAAAVDPAGGSPAPSSPKASSKPLVELDPDDQTARIRDATREAAARSKEDPSRYDEHGCVVPGWVGWKSADAQVQTEMSSHLLGREGKPARAPPAQMTTDPLPFGLREPWFGAWCRPCPVPNAVLQRWREPRNFQSYWHLAPPPANAWIPATLDLRADSDSHRACQEALEQVRAGSAPTDCAGERMAVSSSDVSVAITRPEPGKPWLTLGVDRVPLDGRRPLERCALLLRAVPPAGHEPGSLLWFWRDNMYGQPHSMVRVHIRLPLAQQAMNDTASFAGSCLSARAIASRFGTRRSRPGDLGEPFERMCQGAADAFQLQQAARVMWAALVADALQPQLYDAALAGVNGSLFASSQGFIVTVQGYYDCMPKLLQLLLDALIPSRALDRGARRGTGGGVRASGAEELLGGSDGASAASGGTVSDGAKSESKQADEISRTDPLDQIPFTRRFNDLKEARVRAKRSMLLDAGSLAGAMRQRSILMPPPAYPTGVLPTWQRISPQDVWDHVGPASSSSGRVGGGWPRQAEGLSLEAAAGIAPRDGSASLGGCIWAGAQMDVLVAGNETPETAHVYHKIARKAGERARRLAGAEAAPLSVTPVDAAAAENRPPGPIDGLLRGSDTCTVRLDALMPLAVPCDTNQPAPVRQSTAGPATVGKDEDRPSGTKAGESGDGSDSDAGDDEEDDEVDGSSVDWEDEDDDDDDDDEEEDGDGESDDDLSSGSDGDDTGSSVSGGGGSDGSMGDGQHRGEGGRDAPEPISAVRSASFQSQSQHAHLCHQKKLSPASPKRDASVPDGSPVKSPLARQAPHGTGKGRKKRSTSDNRSLLQVAPPLLCPDGSIRRVCRSRRRAGRNSAIVCYWQLDRHWRLFPGRGSIEGSPLLKNLPPWAHEELHPIAEMQGGGPLEARGASASSSRQEGGMGEGETGATSMEGQPGLGQHMVQHDAPGQAVLLSHDASAGSAGGGSDEGDASSPGATSHRVTTKVLTPQIQHYHGSRPAHTPTVVCVLLRLLESWLGEPLFDQLRTKEQLGYIVSGSYTLSDGIPGYKLRIVSKSYSPWHLESRAISFMAGSLQRLQEAILCGGRGAGAGAGGGEGEGKSESRGEGTKEGRGAFSVAVEGRASNSESKGGSKHEDGDNEAMGEGGGDQDVEQDALDEVGLELLHHCTSLATWMRQRMSSMYSVAGALWTEVRTGRLGFGDSLQDAEVLEAWASAMKKEGEEGRRAMLELCRFLEGLFGGMLRGDARSGLETGSGAGAGAGAGAGGEGDAIEAAAGAAGEPRSPHRLSCMVFGRGYLKAAKKGGSAKG